MRLLATANELDRGWMEERMWRNQLLEWWSVMEEIENEDGPKSTKVNRARG